MMSDAPDPRSRWTTRSAILLPAAALLAVAVGCGGDDDARVSELTVMDAWARPTPAVAPNGAIYLTIVSPVDDVLQSVSVPASIAAEVTLHETVEVEGGHDMDHGHGADEDGMDMTSMTGMEGLASVPLPAQELVSFQPNGLHIMLEQLADPLTDGERFRAVLTFRTAGERDVEVVVGDGAP